jgi:uncharacterized membrane protein (DUF106 family)
MFEELLKTIPFSTFLILLLAASLSFLTSLANRLLSNPEKLKASRKEVSEWNSELREARRNNDKKRVDKLMKKQQYIMQLQSKMMWQSTKVMLLFIVPLFIIWQVLGGFFTTTVNGTSISVPIAYFPGFGPIFPILSFPSLFWWYLLCSFLFGTVFSHLLGVTSIGE